MLLKKKVSTNVRILSNVDNEAMQITLSHVCISQAMLAGAEWSIFEGSKNIYMPDINIGIYQD